MKSKIIKAVYVFALLYALPSLVSAATLSISPATSSVVVGSDFSVDILLDTEGVPVDGVDIIYLNYNPSQIQIQDANTSLAGIQITPGTLMSSTLVNTTNESSGRVTFSQVSTGGTRYNGSGTLASISFKALTTGTASLVFNFTPGLTTDSNVASNQIDILDTVTNGSYVINSPPPPPPSSPPPSTPPASSGGGGGGGSSSSGGGGGSPAPVIVPATSITTVSNSGGVNQVTIYVPLNITRWLTVGSTGQDVLQLHKALNQNGFAVATNGAESLNKETTYFGPATAAAIRKFQCAKLQVCQGTPETTGYGGVGPRTRQALSLLKIASVSSVTVSTASTTALTSVPGCPAGFICRLASATSTSSLPTIQYYSTTTLPVFTRNLTLGAVGADVKSLQIYLNSRGFTIATSGGGSPGYETMYFGQATQSALVRFQRSNGIVPASGFFGPLTRGYIK